MNQTPDSILKMQQSKNRSGLTKDQFDYSMFDTVDISNSADKTEQRLFTVAVGGAKTYADTNMKSNGMIPQGKRMTVYGIKLFFLFPEVGGEVPPTTDQTFWSALYHMCFNSTLSFKIDGKEEFGTWSLCELIGFNLGIASPVGHSSYARDQVKDHFPINNPIDLPATQNFEVILKHYKAVSPALNTLRLKVSIVGVLENAN